MVDMDMEVASALLHLTAKSLDLLSAADEIDEKVERPKRKRCWIKKWRETRAQNGNIQFLLNEYKLALDQSRYKSYLRMDEACSRRILSLVENDISRQNTIMRACIPTEEKLAVVLRFLATGESYKELDENTKLSIASISEAVVEVCESIYKNGRHLFLKFPDTKNEWVQISKEFESRWQFPQCLDAIDGKHVAFTPRKHNAQLFHNYKGFKSIVLLAVADVYAKFTFIDVGCNGRISDGGVLNRSKFMNILQKGEQYLPPTANMGENRTLPYVFVGDNAFPLLKHLLTSYPFTTSDPDKIMYNYRLSRARQNVERAFGILSTRFRVLQKQIMLDEVKTIKIVQACCVLHNFLITNSNWYIENTSNFVDTPCDTSLKVSSTVGQRAENATGRNEDIRKSYKEYFCKEGKI